MMNEYKIMVVDDEPDILDLIEKALNIEGLSGIIKIDNGMTAVNTCRKIQPDIIILDVMLPDIDGYEVCKQIRQFSHCPILFLSSKNDELDKILGLAVGGDDYVTKPFSPKEVAYRVKAQLRRTAYKNKETVNEPIKIGALTLDTDGCRAMKDGKDMELTPKNLRYCNIWPKTKGGLSAVSVYMRQSGMRIVSAVIIRLWFISDICVKNWKIILTHRSTSLQ